MMFKIQRQKLFALKFNLKIKVMNIKGLLLIFRSESKVFSRSEECRFVIEYFSSSEAKRAL